MGIYNYSISIPFFNEYSSRGYYAFFFGILLANYVKKNLNSKLIIISLLSTILIIITLIFWPNYITDKLNYIVTFVLYPSIIIVFESNLLKKVFRFKFIDTFSKISFDVYIWHSPLFVAMYDIIKFYNLNLNLMSLKAMLSFTGIAVIVGTISYYMIEKNINKLVTK